MTKIAIVTDSNSGITQSQAEELGVFVVPMPFMIDGETYYEDVNLTQNMFYEMLQDGAKISTSQPSPETVLLLWEQLLQDYDEIVYIPMSSGLSGSCQSARMLAMDFDNKVQVVNNHRISVTLKQSVLDAKLMAEKGYSAEKIKDILEEDGFNSSIYIMLDTLEYLKRGGRITPAAAAIGTMLRLKPVLTIQGEKLDAFAKARTVTQGKSIMINAVKTDIEKRFGGKIDPDEIWIQMAYTNETEAVWQFRKEIEEAFPGCPVQYNPLSLSIACHIGPGSIAMACTRKLKI